MSGPREELLKSRTELLAVLDAKLTNLPEWRAFRAVDRAVEATTPATNGAVGPAVATRIMRRPPAVPSYAALGIQALDRFGLPLTTPEMIEFMAQRRQLPADPDRARTNIVSALSHNERVQNIPWRGGRAWWHADKPVPKDETAGSKLNL